MNLRILSVLLLPVSLHAVTVPNFAEHVAPIVFNKCTGCHRPGEAAPFSFLNYRDVSKRGRLIAEVTQSGFMPPWHVESRDFEFADNRALSEAGRTTLKEWVMAGMPEGDPEKLPALPSFSAGWQLGEPDLVLKMPAAYEVPAEGPDIYRNFVIPLNLPEDKWIRAIEFRPGVRSVVHHSLFYFDTDGTARKEDGRDGSPGFRRMVGGLARNAIGGWAVGGVPRLLPDGLAYRLPKGSDIVLSTHFHPSGKPEREQSTIGVYFSGNAPERGFTFVQLPPVFGALAGVSIPAGEAGYVKTESFTLPVDVTAFSVSAHAHYLGKEMELTAELPDGGQRQLMAIRDWDFSWQEEYGYARPVRLPAGTKLTGRIVWDNSEQNVNNPNHPPKPVRWGRESGDEMGCVTLMVVPDKEADLDKLKSTYRGHVRDAASRSVAERFSQGEGESGTLLERVKARFDRDGDGRLNAAEQEQARKFYRQNRF
jgi:hypothetical protein